MAVNIRLKYNGNPNLTKRNRPYKAQLDYILNGKRKRDIIKDITFYPDDTKEIKKEKERIVEKIRSQLEIELGNTNNGMVSRQLQKGNFITYFEKLGNNKKGNTKSTWDNTLKHLYEFQGNKINFEDISTVWLENFIKFLKNKELANNSIITYLNKINAALNQAVKEKIIFENSLKHINKPKKEETDIVYLLEDEIQKIIDTKFWDNEAKNAFLFGCYTGLRASDIQNLKWTDIQENQIKKSQIKTKNIAYIPLNPNSKMILEKQKHNQKFVFKLSNHTSSLNRTIKKMIKLTDIKKDVHFHCSRHTFATLLVTAGTDIFTIAKLMGHKDIKSTMVYAKVIDKKKEEAVNSMKNFEF